MWHQVKVSAFAVTLMGAVCATALAQELDPKSLLRKVDQLYRADTSQADMTMTITTPDWKRELKIRSWSRGMKKTLIRILAPKKDEGVATLRIEREMWNYFPKINKVVKVPPSMMMGSWMGSDFTNDDLVRETSLEDEYEVALKSTESDYLLTLTPKASTPTVWGKIEVRMDRKSLLPMEQIYYDEKGVKVRVMRLKDIRDFGGRKLPAVMELIPLNKEGNSTVVTYDSAVFNAPIDESVFSLRNLKKK